MKLIFNLETGEVIERELNDEEIAQQKIDESNTKKMKEEMAKAEKEKNESKALIFERLGITEEEAKILLS